MDNDYYVSLVTLMDEYSGEQRRQLVSGYYYDTFDDEALTKMPASFFAELLKNEKDSVCKWYEIKAIGDLRATEYIELLISVLFEENEELKGGSSLHLIAADSLGKMGEVVIPSVISAFDSANETTRLALIDTLGETRCSSGAVTIESFIPRYNLKEFNYAMLALTKCGNIGQETLRKLYYSCDDKEKKLCVVDALCYFDGNDDLLKNTLYDETDILLSLFTAKTRGASYLFERISKTEKPWTLEDKDFINQKGIFI